MEPHLPETFGADLSVLRLDFFSTWRVDLRVGAELTSDAVRCVAVAEEGVLRTAEVRPVAIDFGVWLLLVGSAEASEGTIEAVEPAWIAEAGAVMKFADANDDIVEDWAAAVSHTAEPINVTVCYWTIE